MVGWIAVEGSRRTVNSEVVSSGDTLMSVSLTTAEIAPDGDDGTGTGPRTGTDLRVTVHLARLSGDMAADDRAGFAAGLGMARGDGQGRGRCPRTPEVFRQG